MGRDGFERPSSYLLGVLQFFAVSIGSIGIGALISALSALLLRRIDMRGHASFELAFVLLIGYCAYSTAEAWRCSGILSLFTTGVLIGHYHIHSLSQVARESAGVPRRGELPNRRAAG